jgi:hypothetical protein
LIDTFSGNLNNSLSTRGLISLRPIVFVKNAGESIGKLNAFIAFLTGGRDGVRKIPTTIDLPSKKASDYDMVLIGGPLWDLKV